MSGLNNNFFDRFPNWLRWLFLPFVVVFTFFAATAAIGVIFWFARISSGVSENSVLGWLHYYVAQPCVGGYAFVLIGSFVAPTKKFATSLVLGGLFATMNGMGIMDITILGYDFGMLVAFITGTVGAGMAVYQVKAETN